MKAHVMKLENNCVIVDEEYFNEIKKESEFNLVFTTNYSSIFYKQ